MPIQRTIELHHARQLNITRQHLDQAERPPLLDVIRDLGCLQLDPISAVQRSHLLVLWSRLGAYDTADVDALIYQDRVLFEYWAHEASIVLSEDYPIHRFRMQDYPGEGGWSDRIRAWIADDVSDLRTMMLKRFEAEGPLPSRAFEDKTVGSLHSSGWTSDRNVSRMLQHLWHSGAIGVSRREGIQRFWDLTERCLPAWASQEVWDMPKVVEVAVQKAIRALGVARPDHIKLHYTRHRYPNMTAALVALVSQSLLEQVTITREGKALPGTWYLHTADIPVLERIQAGAWQPRTTLLSPFDNLICDRKRLYMMFDFDYHIEIYTPQAKRQYGYYVLPILQGDRLIGRIDPRYDRKTRTLAVQAVYAEDNAPIDTDSISAIKQSISDLATWLGAKTIDISPQVPPQWAALREN